MDVMEDRSAGGVPGLTDVVVLADVDVNVDGGLGLGQSGPQ